MSVYLDASVLVSFVVRDGTSDRAIEFLRAEAPQLIVSNLAQVEVSSALARLTRIGDLSMQSARTAFAKLDEWLPGAATQIQISHADMDLAQSHLRRLDLPLRTADAIHVAVAQRLDAEIATFDRQMTVSARALGVALALS